MRDNFQSDLKRCLVYEGGYVNDPRDPGGETNKGITKRVYDGYRKGKNLPVRSVKLIQDYEVTEIYRSQYADKVQYDRLPAGIDGVVFDGAVNSGPARSVMWLQKALGTVRVDGVIGDATISAATDYPDHDKLVALIIENRLKFLKALTTWSHFGAGWGSRVAQVKKAGQAVASGSVGPAPVFFMGGQAKGFIESAKTPPSKAIGDATTGGGVITVAINNLTESLNGLTWLPHMDQVLSIVTATGGLMIAGGLAYRWYQTRAVAKLNDALDIRPSLPEVTPA